MGCSQLVPTASLCLEHPTPGPQLAAQKWLSSSSSPHPIQTYPRFSSKSSEMRLLIDVTEASLLVPRGVVRHLDWKTRNWESMSYRWFHLRACFEHSLARNRGGTTSQWKRHGHSTYSRPVVVVAPACTRPAFLLTAPQSLRAIFRNLCRSLGRERDLDVWSHRSPIRIIELMLMFDWNNSQPDEDEWMADAHLALFVFDCRRRISAAPQGGWDTQPIQDLTLPRFLSLSRIWTPNRPSDLTKAPCHQRPLGARYFGN